MRRTKRSILGELLEVKMPLDANGLPADAPPEQLQQTQLTATIDAAEGESDQVPDFSLVDVNPTSATYNQRVSPRDYLGKTSAWYFGHAT